MVVKKIFFLLWLLLIIFADTTVVLAVSGPTSDNIAVFDFSAVVPVGAAIRLLDNTVQWQRNNNAANRHDIVRRDAGSSDPNIFVDNHVYYNKTVAINHPLSAYYSAEFDRIFSTYPTKTNLNMNNGRNLALTVPLKFPFDFYGHPVKTVVITTGGFIYMNELSHPYLSFSQFIAPLMADFETKSDISSIKFVEIEDAFWVRWENLIVSSNFSLGTFSFQCALFSNGSIVFDYISIPISMAALRSASSILKIGLSDAFYYDVQAPVIGAVLRRIVKYHELVVPWDHVATDGIIHLIHLPTCNQQTNCSSCTNRANVPSFNCSWCYELNRCSSGLDRRLQQWHDSDCHYTLTKRCWNKTTVAATTAIPTSTTAMATIANADVALPTTEGTEDRVGDQDCAEGACISKSGSPMSRRDGKTPAQAANERSGRITLGVCLGLLGLGLVACLAGVLLYGFRHPGSSIGAWLIEHRPSRCRERFFGGGPSASSGGVAGDSYKVSSDNAYANFSNA